MRVRAKTHQLIDLMHDRLQADCNPDKSLRLFVDILSVYGWLLPTSYSTPRSTQLC